MQSPATPTGIGALPPEILTMVAERLSQGARYSLSLVSTRFRQLAEPFLYRNVCITRVAASRCFHRTIISDPIRAGWVHSLRYHFDDIEPREDCPADVEVLAFLPDLTSLEIESPYHEDSAWRNLLQRALSPNASERVLSRLRSCLLWFWDDNGEFWHSYSDSLNIIYLPSLEQLEVRYLESEYHDPKPPPGSSNADLQPLTRLCFIDCDMRAQALEDFLAIRSARAVSLLRSDLPYPPVEIGISELREFVPALIYSVHILEALQFNRYYDRQESPVPLKALTSLRMLNIDPIDLFGDQDIQVDRLRMEDVLPPNIQTIAFDCLSTGGLLDESAALIQSFLQDKERLVPELQRVEFLGVDGGVDYLQPTLKMALDSAGVAHVLRGEYSEHDRNNWIRTVMCDS